MGIVLNLQNGKTIKIDEYKLLPDWLDESEKHFLRTVSAYIGRQSLSTSLYEKYKNIDKFIQSYSIQQFDNADFVEMMSEENLVAQMHAEMQGKILSKIIKGEKFSQTTPGKKNKLEQIKVSTDEGIKSLIEVANGDVGISEDVINSVLSEVDSLHNVERLRERLARKLRSLKADTPYQLKTKLIRHGLSLGFPTDVVIECAESLINDLNLKNECETDEIFF